MAALKKQATRKTQAAALEPTPRHLWLASLGMLVAARRQSKAVAKRVAHKLEATIADARYVLRRAEAELRASRPSARRSRLRAEFQPISCR